MLATLITICINVLAFSIGMYVGSLVFGNDETKVYTETKNQIKIYHPIVLSFVFRQALTKSKLVADVLKPSWIQFAHHWDCLTEAIKWPDGLDQFADKVMEWYNPDSDYNELLLIAHTENGGFTVDFTWKKPEHGAVDELGA